MDNHEIFFKWRPEYSVNIETIDNQLQELVNILNRLFVALEERLMRQARYKDLEPHIAEHRKLLEQLDQLAKKHMLEEKAIYFEMLELPQDMAQGAHPGGIRNTAPPCGSSDFRSMRGSKRRLPNSPPCRTPRSGGDSGRSPDQCGALHIASSFHSVV